MHGISLVMAALTLLLGTARAATGDIDCGVAVGCRPWAGGDGESALPCSRDKRINLRFMLEIADENRAASGVNDATALYGFCPIVDRVELLSLKGAPSLASIFIDAGVARFSQNVGTKHLSVYGFGLSNSTFIPDRMASAGSVVVAADGTSLCATPHSVALVQTLTLDIGFHMGLFNYIGVSEPTEETENAAGDITDGGFVNLVNRSVSARSEFAVQPAMVGFRPTCNANDVCLFDANSVCVGEKVGSKNCASCYDTPEDVRNAQLRVWVSYYGTDDNGRPMKSGGLNPLNFRQFAGNGLWSEIAQMFPNK